MLYRLIGFWVLRRAYRIVTADDPRSLGERLGGEGKRILTGAAITLALLLHRRLEPGGFAGGAPAFSANRFVKGSDPVQVGVKRG